MANVEDLDSIRETYVGKVFDTSTFEIDDDDVSRRAVAALWNQGALPFETSEPAVCDGIAQGHYGMTFSLVAPSDLERVPEVLGHVVREGQVPEERD